MKKLFIFFLVCLPASFCFAQVELGLYGGIANYQGDLTDQAFKSPKPAVALSIGIPFSPRINFRSELAFARVAGADSLNKSDLRFRNLSFQSPVTELSVVGEFYSFDLNLKTWSPYVFAGIAVYHFNPYTFNQQGQKVFLQPLSTEGQGLPGYPDNKAYALTQLSIPFGAGIKFNISEKVRIGLETGLRKLFTDYLDDVSGNYADPTELLNVKGQQSVDLSYRGDEVPGGSADYPAKGAQRGSPKYKDYYYFTGLRVVYRLPEGKGGGVYRHAARKSGYGCPTVF